MKKIIHNKQGSIALISVLIIATMLIIVTVGMSEINTLTAHQYMNTNSNTSTIYLAEGCLEEAISRIEDDIDFSGTTLTMDENSSCTIAVSGAATKTIDISTTFYEYSQNYQAEILITTQGQANNSSLSKMERI